MHSVHLAVHRQCQLIKRNVMQISGFIFHRFVYGTQLLVGFTELLPFFIRTVEAHIAIVLYQQNRRFTFAAQYTDTFLQTRTNQLCAVVRHIRHTVYHIHCRIHFGQKLEETFVQLPVARKAQVDDRHIQLTLQDIGPGHTGT